MLTFSEAREIGVNACIDRLGREFVEKYRDNACNAFADVEDHVFCFVGVDDRQPRQFLEDEPLTLDDRQGNEFPYRVSCNVKYSDGKIEFVDCVLP